MYLVVLLSDHIFKAYNLIDYFPTVMKANET